MKLLPDEHGLVRQIVVKTRGSKMRGPVRKLSLMVPTNLDVVPQNNSDDPALMVE